MIHWCKENLNWILRLLLENLIGSLTRDLEKWKK